MAFDVTQHPRTSGLPHIVIIGGGFGGIDAARTLAGLPVDITLIDRKNHHCFQPLLYQVATASLAAPDVAWPIRSLLRAQANVNVVMNEVISVDKANRHVTCGDGRRYPFDYLIVATGATHGYFGHPEWEQFAPGLKTIEDATRVRSSMLSAFERAETATELTEQASLLTFVVIGGGPTGVEMAGSISDLARNILEDEFRHIDTSRAKVILVEAGPRLLAAFPDRLSRYAEKALKARGVEVTLSDAVTVCDADGVTLRSGRRIDAGFMFWAAGVRASPACSWLDAQCDRAGRTKVNRFLQDRDSSRVFVIGDTASVEQDGNAVPGVAPAAKQMGAYVGRFIAHEIAGKPTEPFIYVHQGDLAAIGKAAAIVKLRKLELTGFVAWIFWGVAHIYFLIERKSRVVVALNWLVEYSMSKRGARIIS
jgi:NADH dehydrogenase